VGLPGKKPTSLTKPLVAPPIRARLLDSPAIINEGRERFLLLPRLSLVLTSRMLPELVPGLVPRVGSTPGLGSGASRARALDSSRLLRGGLGVAVISQADSRRRILGTKCGADPFGGPGVVFLRLCCFLGLVFVFRRPGVVICDPCNGVFWPEPSRTEYLEGKHAIGWAKVGKFQSFWSFTSNWTYRKT